MLQNRTGIPDLAGAELISCAVFAESGTGRTFFEKPTKKGSSMLSESDKPKKKNKKKTDLEKAILSSLFGPSSVAKTGQYVGEYNRIVDRCGAHSELVVNRTTTIRGKEVESGKNSQNGGENWTGIMADVGGMRYGAATYGRAWESEKQSNSLARLKSCAEGKCLYDLMSRGIKAEYFKPSNDILINIYIKFDSPCEVCSRAIQDWIDQYRDMCKSLQVTVYGNGSKPFHFG